jgi:hypothetical protein
MAGSVLALTMEHGRPGIHAAQKIAMGFISRWLPDKRKRTPGVASLILSETEFHAALHLEHCRTQRCKRPFLFMRAAPAEVAAKQDNEALLAEFASEMAASSREADIFGWERQGRTLGAVFTEVGPGAADFIRRRAIAIQKKLPGGDSRKLILSFQFFTGTTDF